MTTCNIFVKTKKTMAHANISYDEAFLKYLYEQLLEYTVKDIEQTKILDSSLFNCHENKNVYLINQKYLRHTKNKSHPDGEDIYEFTVKLYTETDFLYTLRNLMNGAEKNILANSHRFKMLFEYIPKDTFERQIFLATLEGLTISPLVKANGEYESFLKEFLETRRKVCAYEAYWTNKIKKDDQPNYKLNRALKKRILKTEVIEKLPKESIIQSLGKPLLGDMSSTEIMFL